MRKIFAFILLLIFLAGCSEPLRKLMQVNKEQGQQQKHVTAQDSKFKRLLVHIDRDKLRVGKRTKAEILRLYGEPIAQKEVDGRERWLYRKATDFFPTKKVYLFFDQNDTLVDFELIEKDES